MATHQDMAASIVGYIRQAVAEIRYGLQKRPAAVRLKALAVMDLLIAGHALNEGCALVTADQAFANVAELELELEAW